MRVVIKVSFYILIIMENSHLGLENLFIKKAINLSELRKTLFPYLRIDPENKKIYLLPDFSKLSYKDGVIIVLLGIKYLKEENMRDSELIGPTEISNISKINKSTVKNALRELERERIAVSEKGKYTVPNFVLEVLLPKFEKLSEKLKSKESKVIKQIPRKVSRIINFSKIEKIFAIEPEKFAGELHDFLVKEKGKYLKKALVVIKLAKEKCGIDGLSAAEITKILQEHLRVSRIHHSNITTALGSRTASEYVFKQPTKSKKVYLYRITKLGEDLVDMINLQPKEK